VPCNIKVSSGRAYHVRTMRFQTCRHFIKQAQWEHWRAKRKLVLGESTKALLRGSGDCYHPSKNFEIEYTKSYNLVHFGRKMVHKHVLKHFNDGNGVSKHSPWNDPCSELHTRAITKSTAVEKWSVSCLGQISLLCAL